MRPLYALLLLLLVTLPSCHVHRRRVERRAAKNHAEYRKSTEPKYTTADYIATYKTAAIHQMKKYGIPASITLAQGILESGNGNSELARNANNHFGIKCTSDWTGKTYIQDDETKNECFRRYKTVEDSYRDHAEFLKNKGRYASLFQLDSDDCKGWAHGLKKCGYATNPKYPELLLNLVKKYELDRYDK